MQEALDDGVTEEGLDAAFWVGMEERRNDWALVMLRGAHVLKGAGEDDWRSFATTACALLDGRALGTVPVMEYIYGETADAWLTENYGRLSECDDGTAKLVRLIAAAAGPEDDLLAEENSAWADGHLSAAVLSPFGAPSESLIATAAERLDMGDGGRAAGRFATTMRAKYAAVEAGYREAKFVARTFAGLDERELWAWAQGLALGVGIRRSSARGCCAQKCAHLS